MLKEQLRSVFLQVTLYCSEADPLEFVDEVVQESLGIHVGKTGGDIRQLDTKDRNYNITRRRKVCWRQNSFHPRAINQVTDCRRGTDVFISTTLSVMTGSLNLYSTCWHVRKKKMHCRKTTPQSNRGLCLENIFASAVQHSTCVCAQVCGLIYLKKHTVYFLIVSYQLIAMGWWEKRKVPMRSEHLKNTAKLFQSFWCTELCLWDLCYCSQYKNNRQ